MIKLFRQARLGALVVALVPLAVYLLTLQNGLTPGELRGGDPITHQYAQAMLRFSNAPGYPIFSALGWVWFQLSALLTPFFNPIERLTFYSTLYAIPALVLLYYVILDLLAAPLARSADGDSNLSAKTAGAGLHPVADLPRAAGEGGQSGCGADALGRSSGDPVERGQAPQPATRNTLIAVLVTLLFAFTYFFWYYAISSENYSSGTLNTLVIIALALRWQKRRDERTLLWLCFACGLSLAHLLTVALAVPAVILFVVAQAPGYLRRPRLLAGIALATFLPLLSYAYVYWRGAEHPEWRGQGSWPSAWAWFIDFIRTQQGQAELTWSWDGIPWGMLSLMANELTPLVLLGGVAGLLLLIRGAGPQAHSSRWRGILFLGILAVYLPEMYLDRYGNWFQTVIALYPVFMMGFALLLQQLADEATRLLARAWPALTERVPGIVTAALVLSLMLLALNRLASNYAADNLRDRSGATGLNLGWQLLADQPEPGGRIAGTYDEDLALDYLTQVWGAQPPVKPVSVNQVNALPADQPLYASRAAMALLARLLLPTAHLSSHGLSLVAIRAEPTVDVPAAAQVPPRALGHGLELIGQQARLEPGRQHLTIYWRAAQHIDVDMAVSVRLIHGAQLISQVDSAAPVGGFYPMTRWQTGGVVRDDYALPLKPEDAPDRLHIILYRTVDTGFENLAEWDVPPGK